MDFGNNAEDSDEDSTDSYSDEDLESEEEDSYIVAQRVDLKNHAQIWTDMIWYDPCLFTSWKNIYTREGHIYE